MQCQKSSINRKWTTGMGRRLGRRNPAYLGEMISDLFKVLPWIALAWAPDAMAIPLPPLTASTSGDLGAQPGGPHRPMLIVPPAPGAMAVGNGVAGPRRPGLIASPSKSGPMASRP